MNNSKPTWLYKLVNNVTNLNLIQDEMLTVYKKYYSNSFGDKGFMFCYVSLDIIREECPNYIAYLKEIELYDKWCLTVFIGVKSEKRLTDSPIHIDHDDWKVRSYALNIPIINCEDSYTVWYDCKERNYDYAPMDAERNPKVNKSALAFRPETSTEIGRLNVNNPAWINVSIPHRAENNNPNLRFLASARFYPELHDFNFDQFSP